MSLSLARGGVLSPLRNMGAPGSQRALPWGLSPGPVLGMGPFGQRTRPLSRPLCSGTCWHEHPLEQEPVHGGRDRTPRPLAPLGRARPSVPHHGAGNVPSPSRPPGEKIFTSRGSGCLALQTPSSPPPSDAPAEGPQAGPGPGGTLLRGLVSSRLLPSEASACPVLHGASPCTPGRRGHLRSGLPGASGSSETGGIADVTAWAPRWGVPLGSRGDVHLGSSLQRAGLLACLSP